MRSIPRTGALLAIAAGLTLAGCSVTSDDSASDESTGGAALAPSAADGGASGGSGGEGAAEGGNAAIVELDRVQSDDAREVVHTAKLVVRVKDSTRAYEEARAIVRDSGGFVESSDADVGSAATVNAVVRVPPGRFDAVVDELATLGRLVKRSTDTEDVTGQVVDLEARLAAAQASADRLRELIDESGNVGDLLAVERELATREGTVESLTSQLAVVRARVDLATVRLSLRQSTPPATAEEPRAVGFGRGLEAGWDAATASGRAAAATAGFLLPFTLVMAPLALAAWFLVARVRRSSGHPA